MPKSWALGVTADELRSSDVWSACINGRNGKTQQNTPRDILGLYTLSRGKETGTG